MHYRKRMVPVEGVVHQQYRHKHKEGEECEKSMFWSGSADTQLRPAMTATQNLNPGRPIETLSSLHGNPKTGNE